MPGGIDFAVLGLSHKTAPLDVRERLASAPEQMGDILRGFSGLEPVREVALLSTCNRVEVYLAATDPDAAIAALRRHLADRAGVSELELANRLYARVGVDAVHSLFREDVGTIRTPPRAEQLAARIGGRTHPSEYLHVALVQADIVIASTGARRPPI